jgi:hypothetical protein
MDVKKRKIIIAIISFIGICLLALSVVKFLPYAENLNQTRIKLGVVDLETLLPLHSDWSNLKSLDAEISNLEDKLNGNGAGLEKFQQKQYLYMKQEQDNAEKELKAEMKKAEEALSYQQQLLEQNLKNERTRLSGKIKALNGSQPSSGKGDKSFEKHLQDYARDLYFLKDRQLVAYRLEQEKKIKADLELKQQMGDQEVGNFEQNLLKSHQNKKLNLMLKLQTATNEDDARNLQNELKVIEDEDNLAKENKRKEENFKIEAYKKEALNQVKQEVKAYGQKLEKDLEAQLYKEKLNLAGLSGTSPSSTEAIDLQSEERKLAVEFENQKSGMENRLNALRSNYLQNLEAKRVKLQQHLLQTQKELSEAMLKESKALKAQEQERDVKLAKDLENLKQERVKLYNNIVKETKEEISRMAQAKGIFLVLTGYVTNLNGIDLTKEAEALLRKERL